MLHEHHLIIRVGAGLIQFLYGSHSRMAADTHTRTHTHDAPHAIASPMLPAPKGASRATPSILAIINVEYIANHKAGRLIRHLRSRALNKRISRKSMPVRCSMLQRVAARCSVLQCVAVCCSVLQCVAVCCSVAVREYLENLLTVEFTMYIHHSADYRDFSCLLVRAHKKLAVRSVTPSHVPLANILKSQLYGDCT